MTSERPKLYIYPNQPGRWLYYCYKLPLFGHQPVLMVYNDTPLLNFLSCSRSEDADFMVVPFCFAISYWPTNEKYLKWADDLLSQHCEKLHYFKKEPERHIFLDTSDSPYILPITSKSIIFKSSIEKGNKIAYPFYYFSPKHNNKPITDCQYDVSFQGRITWKERTKIPAAMNKCQKTGLQTYFKEVNQPIDRKMPEKLFNESEYMQSINNSKFILCPRGHGLTSVRFFEAMSFGRIPILLADQTAMPLEELINYDDFIVKVPEKDILDFNKYVHKFLNTHDLKLASDLSQKTHDKYFSNTGDFLYYSLRTRI